MKWAPVVLWSWNEPTLISGRVPRRHVLYFVITLHKRKQVNARRGSGAVHGASGLGRRLDPPHDRAERPLDFVSTHVYATDTAKDVSQPERVSRAEIMPPRRRRFAMK